MIAAEIFGYDCGGAIHCVYDDGRDDWMVHPFRTDRCEAVHILGDDRLLAVGQRFLALFDARRRVEVARLPMRSSQKLTIGLTNDHILLSGLIGEGILCLSVYSLVDLSDALRVEDRALNSIDTVHERHDGAFIVAGMVEEGDRYVTYAITFDEGTVRAEKFEGAPRLGYRSPHWVDPQQKRVAALSRDPVPVSESDGAITYGIKIDVWSFDTLEIESSVVVDRLPLELHPKYWGQELRPSASADRQDWQAYVAAINAIRRLGPSRPIYLPAETLQDDESKALRAEFQFRRESVVDVAWEPSGEAFWILLFPGILRRVGIDGSISQRYVVECFATPPALGRKHRKPFPPSVRPVPRTVCCFSDKCIQVDGDVPPNLQTTSAVQFDPAEVAAGRQSLSQFFPKSLFGAPTGYLVRRQHEGYPSAPSLPLPPEQQEAEARKQALERRLVDADADEIIKARRKEFERRTIEADVPLASLSEFDCIAAIDWLTEAITERFPELVCAYWFRPVFVLPTSPAGKSQMPERLSEETFFAHVAEQDPAAADSLERLIDAFIPEARRVSPYLAGHYIGPDEETPAMAHAVKALVTLDPTRYRVLRRYFTATEVEHDAFVKDEVTRVFGERNGWRDLEAIRLGLFWLFEQWSAGSGSYECLWHEFGLGTEVQLRFAPEEFARLFVQEAEDYFATPDKDASINRPEWRPELASNFFSDVREALFGGSGDFNKRLLREMDRRLSCDAA